MKINPLGSNRVSFNKIVETFRREIKSTWQDGMNPEKVETVDTFECVKEVEEEGENNG
jgi:hypothetical protein